jgi:uncharacterized membrane protein YkoI
VALAAGAFFAIGGCLNNDKEVAVSMSDVPTAAREGITKQLAGAEATKIEREMKNGKLVYEVHTMRDGKMAEFKVGEDGSLVGREKVKGGDGKHEEEKEEADDEKEEHGEHHDAKSEAAEADEKDEKGKNEEVDVSKLPDAVTRAVQDKHPGSTISDAEAKTVDGKTVYELDIKAGQEKRELHVTPDGKIEGDSADDGKD